MSDAKGLVPLMSEADVQGAKPACEQGPRKAGLPRADQQRAAESAGSDTRTVDVALEEIVSGLVEFYLKVAEARDDAHMTINSVFDRIEAARKRLEARVSWIAESVPSGRSR